MPTQSGFLYHLNAVEEERGEGDVSLIMHLHVIRQDGGYECIRVHGYQPFFYVELGNVMSVQMWKARCSEFSRKLLTMARLHQECPGEDTCAMCARGSEAWTGVFAMEWKKKLYHVQKEAWHPVLKMTFANGQQRRNAFYRLHQKKIVMAPYSWELAVHEKEAPATLQFCVDLKLPTTGWIQYERTSMSVRDCTRGGLVVLTDGNRNPAIPRVVAVDIEVYSSNERRMPAAENPEDCVFQISLVSSEDDMRLLHVGSVDPAGLGTIRAVEFPDEASLLRGFARHVREMRPHVICGYNIFGFDFPYLMARATRVGLEREIARLAWEERVVCPVREISWSSSACRNQHFKFWDIAGRVSMDLLPIIRRDYKFDNYKLKTVATAFLGETKDPVSVTDIFTSFRMHLQKDPSARKLLTIVGKYCVQDALLVLRLFSKLNQWIGVSEMARISKVPIPALYLQGQQIKVFSQIYHHCHAHQILVQTPPGENRADKYAGATVFPPKPGMYENVIPFDFASLYPTTIIAYNIDYSTIVPPSRTDIADSDCHIIEWEEHVLCAHDQNKYTPATRPAHSHCGTHRFRFVKSPRGVVPTLLQGLLDARSRTKKEMKQFAKHAMEYNVLDKRQLAYKISANSMYGAMGVQRGYLPFLPGAMSITAKGRESIKTASSLVQSWGGQIVYGDSVAGPTPVIMLHAPCQGVLVCTMDDLRATCSHHEQRLCTCASLVVEGSTPWVADAEGRERWRPASEWSVWTETGWTALLHVYRHGYLKPLVHVWTSTGSVVVTQDHSLLDSDGEALTPLDWIQHPKSLLTTALPGAHEVATISSCLTPPSSACHTSTSCEQLGFQCGFFLRFGWQPDLARHSQFMLPVATTLQERIQTVWTSHDLQMWGSAILHGFALATSGGLGKRNGRDRPQDRSGPASMWLPRTVSVRFMGSHARMVREGMCSDEGDMRTLQDVSLILQWINMVFAFIAGYQGRWTSDCEFSWAVDHVGKDKAWARHAFLRTENSVVYDLTTANHHFQAGIGSLVVHNTDSIYCHFNMPSDTPAHHMWDHAKKMEQRLNEHFPAPMKLAFEDKIYTRFLIVTKKRYMALTCDGQGVHDKDLTIRGVLLARRDNCAWVRECYEQIVRSLFQDATANDVATELSTRFLALFQRELGIRSFVTTKLLSDDYTIRPFLWDGRALMIKCREWDWQVDKTFPMQALKDYAGKHGLPVPAGRTFTAEQWASWQTHLQHVSGNASDNDQGVTASCACVAKRFLVLHALRSQPAHAQLAQRMATRGKPIEPGTRMEFVMCRPFWRTLDDCAKTKIFARIEDPLYVLERRPLLDIDVAYYATSLCTALDQILAIVFGRKLCHQVWQTHLHYDKVMTEFKQAWLGATPPHARPRQSKASASCKGAR